MELGLVAWRRRAHPVRRSRAAGHRLRATRQTWARWRDEAGEAHADAKLIDLLLTLYADAGSCSSLRTADGERPVQRTKA